MSRPTYEQVNELLTPDFATGKLFWNRRDLKYFVSIRACNSWNTRYAGIEAFTCSRNTGYKSGNIFSKNYQAHHILWLLYYKEWPESLDHINGVRDDNRLVNLRQADKQLNGKNTKIYHNNNTGVMGVSQMKNGTFRVRINVEGNTLHLGCFETLDKAREVRSLAEKVYDYHENHGRLN